MRGPPSVQRVSGAHACAGAHENHEMPRADGCGVCILILHHTRTSTCSICPCVLSFAFQDTYLSQVCALRTSATQFLIEYY